MVDAFLLAGGLGSRLLPAVSDRAKPVAMVNGRPFLCHLLAQLERCVEVDRVIVCVGHKSDTVRRALGGTFGRLTLEYSEEREPLGTGGALRHAFQNRTPRADVVAMNGDSYLDLELDALLAFHRQCLSKIALALTYVSDGSRFGAACLDGDRIVKFWEKGASGPAWINAGVYVLSAAASEDLCGFPRVFSFEREAVAKWCEASEARGMKTEGRFLDIGTPEDYARAPAVLSGAKG